MKDLKKLLIGMEKIKNKFLITGGAGFIGSHLVKRLVSKGYQITVIDNLERGKLEFLDGVLDKINFVNEDLREYSLIEKYFENQDCVIHMASKVGGIGTYISKPYEVMSSNISIDSNVLNAIIKYKVEKYFYSSSAHVYPKNLQNLIDSPLLKEDDSYPADPGLSYGWSKLIGEISIKNAVQEHNFLKCSIARFIGIYGPNQDYDLNTGSVIPVFSHRAVKYPKLEFKVWGTGIETRSYCYIEDALDCVELMIKKLDDTVLVGPLNVGKEERISIREIAKIVKEISGKEDMVIDFDIFFKNTVIMGQWCDCGKVKELLGWESKTSLNDGIKIVYENIKNRIENE